MAKYFTINELIRSETAVMRNIDNSPPPEALKALGELAGELLDPVRELWGAPITVNSGFRSPALNKAAGGSPASQHLRGEAADITTGTREGNRRLFEMIAAGDLEFDQLIDELGYAWLHLSYRKNSNRKNILHL